MKIRNVIKIGEIEKVREIEFEKEEVNSKFLERFIFFSDDENKDFGIKFDNDTVL